MWNNITQFLNRCFYRVVVFFFPPKANPLPTDPRSIFIFSSTGIGDALVDSAAIESLHQAYPAAKIIVCAHHRRTSVARHHPHIDAIIPLSKSPLSQWRLLKYFWHRRPDLVIGLHLNAEAVPLGYLLNRHAFVGSQEECRDMAFLLSHPIVTRDERHMVKIGLKVAARTGGVPVKGMIYQVKPEEVTTLRERFSELMEKPYLVMQTGGGKTLNWRDWPVERYIETIRWIEQHYPHRVVLTGGHDNREAGQAIATACPNALNLVERTTLEETATLLHGATLLVSTDTGVMHLGFAIGCPTLALLHYQSGTAVCGPLDFSSGHQVIELPRPALLPKSHASEMGGISMDAVKATLGRMLT
jgi:ADP-heptose:LPS heptosyltransferase